jgi:hypothetical protein
MLIQEFLLWFVAFSCLLVISALAINGLYITTRGETETLPDGSIGKVNDMIFFPLLQLVKRESGYKRVYYQGEHLQRLTRILLKFMPLPAPDDITDVSLKYNTGKLQAEAACKTWNNTTVAYMDERDIKLDAYMSEDGNYCIVQFYKEYPVYVLPKYIRKPLLECIKCMASVWGTLIYWPVVLVVFPFHIAMIPIWVLFCFSLSFLNTFFYNKTK